MYNVNEYAFIVADPRRMRAYADAIAAVVRPGSVVADVGTGGGVMAVLAAKAGARRVYAIDSMPLGSVVASAAARSGVGDIVTFVEGMSTEVTLPERVDVIVSDIHGVLPFFRQHLPSVADARRRFLRDSGVLIPRRDTLYAALVAAPELYQRHVGVFDGAPYGVDMTALRLMAANRWYRAGKDDVSVASTIARIGALDYMEVDDPNLDTVFELTSTAERGVHALCVWFDSELASGVTLSNSPHEEATVYGHAFFPLEQPVVLARGDRLHVRLRASLFGRDYTWTWETESTNRAEPVRFRQSTFKGIALA